MIDKSLLDVEGWKKSMSTTDKIKAGTDVFISGILLNSKDGTYTVQFEDIPREFWYDIKVKK